MHIRFWLDAKLKARTAFDFFDECYKAIYSARCRSNQIVIDAGRFERNTTIPPYVYRVYERELAAGRTLPPQAAKTSRWQDHQSYQPWCLVDSEPGPLLIARKCRDGIYRT